MGGACRSTSLFKRLDRKVLSNVLNQVAHSDPERIGDRVERAQCHAEAASLKPVDMGAVQTGTVGEFFLA